MDLRKKELIAKLEEISALYTGVATIQSRMDGFTPVDIYVREVVVPQFPGKYASDEERNTWMGLIDHDDENAVEKMDKAYERAYCPKEPVKPNLGKRPEHEPAMVNALKKKQGWIPFVAGFVAVCSLISGGLFSGETGTVIGNIVVLIACAAAGLFFYKKLNSAKATDKEVTELVIRTYEENKVEAEEKYEHDMKAYLADRATYVSSKGYFLEEYTAWRETYRAHLREEERIEEKLEADRVAGIKKIYEEQYVPALNKLESFNDLVAAEYLPVLDVIIELIKSGRADDLKEAVNLYEELVYRERQLQLQREQEERRRYEEEQRRRDEERRHREEQKRQQRREADQERHRRFEEDYQRQKEERQKRAEESHQRALENARKNKEYHQTKIQCDGCSMRWGCSMVYKRPNCASFSPKQR